MTRAGAVLILDDDADVQRAARTALAAHLERVEVLSAPTELEPALGLSRAALYRRMAKYGL
jgi:transcriptional regulator of acetoin/glycerol metabolism